MQVALVGWSDGACTSLVIARKCPSRVAGVFFFAGNMDTSGVKDFVSFVFSFAFFSSSSLFPSLFPLPLLPIPFPLSLLYFIVLFDFEGIYANHRAVFQQTHARLLAPLLLSLLLPSISRSCHTHASNTTELHEGGAGRDRCTCDHCTEREG